jgi:hypothetical protein
LWLDIVSFLDLTKRDLQMDFNQVILYVAVGEAALIVGCGVLYAVLALFGLNRSFFWDRLSPAVAALVFTSIAAGVVMMGAGWIAR